MTPKRLSAEDEQRLLAAFDEVSARVEDGALPDDAIVKAAVDLSIPDGHIPLLVRTFNIGAATAHRKTAQELLSKTADFPLADAEQILARLQAGRTQKAAESRISPDYFQGPDWIQERDRLVELEAIPEAVKQAFEQLAESPAVPVRELSVTEHAALRMAPVKQARDRAESANQRAEELQTKVAAALRRLGDYFDREGSLAIADVRDNLKDFHGDSADAVCSYLLTEKQARDRTATAPFHAVDLGQMPYSGFAQVIELLPQARASAHAAIDADAAYQKAAEAAAPRLTLPPVPPPDVPLLATPGAERQKAASEPRQKVALGPFTTTLGVALSRDAVANAMERFGMPDRDALADRAYRELSSPLHEQELSDIRTRALLSRFLQNDQVIASHDPMSVTNAFNDISQLAPRAARQPVLMQALVRKKLEQGVLDPFEGDQLLGTENKLREVEGPHPSLLVQPRGGAKGFGHGSAVRPLG